MEETAIQLEYNVFSHESSFRPPSKEDPNPNSEFKNVSASTDDAISDVTFKSVISLPPFIGKVFMDSDSTAPEELGFLAVLAEKAFLV